MPGIIKYDDIKRLIEAEITAGTYQLGSQLPSEPKLAERYHASRGTIREALRYLEQEAVIARRTGIGTIVLRKPKSATIVSFTEQVRNAGMMPSTVVMVPGPGKIMAAESTERAREAFALLDDERAATTPLYRISRLRCGDGRPLAWQTVYLLVSDFGEESLRQWDYTQSLFDLYARYHRKVAWADEVILARAPTDEERVTLRLDEFALDQPFVYTRERISYDQTNQPLEVLTSVERSDFFRGYRYRILEDALLPPGLIKN